MKGSEASDTRQALSRAGRNADDFVPEVVEGRIVWSEGEQG